MSTVEDQALQILDDGGAFDSSDSFDSSPKKLWPRLKRTALHGLAGDVVRTVLPETESDEAALLFDFLGAAGAAFGPGPHAFADGAEHPGRMFFCVVGKTSRARKGTSRKNIERIIERALPGFVENHIIGGLGSGEGLVHHLRDDREDDEATPDKRVLVHEPEFNRVLRVCAREGSTLSMILREAWDGGVLRVLTRNNPLKATGAYVTVIAHVTQEELGRGLSDTEIANGFANRFGFVLAKRSKKMPHGGSLPETEVDRLGLAFRERLQQAARVGLMQRTEQAASRWEDIYNAIDDEVGGLYGSVTARAEAQMLRLSVLYALLDGSDAIDLEHVEAAKAAWDYCEASAEYLFADSLGDPKADKLLAALIAAEQEGLDGASQHKVFSGNVSGDELDRIRQRLYRDGLAITVSQASEGPGRPRLVTYANGFVPPSALTNKKSETSKPSPAPISSFDSFSSSPSTNGHSASSADFCEVCGEPCSFTDEQGRCIHVGCKHPGAVSVIRPVEVAR